jgi:membrane protein DedA with SNARE-associated domain/rhodanese-related sulfurtransferase
MSSATDNAVPSGAKINAMPDIQLLIAHYGVAVVVANVLLERLGLPIPSFPALIVAGAAMVGRSVSVNAVIAGSLLACLLADGIWYVAGREYGGRVLKLLCKISLSPDSCVRQTEATWEHWGGWTLVFGKFIPGVATVGPPLAGAMRLPATRFLVLSFVGSAIWTIGGICVGFLLSAQISSLLAYMSQAGLTAAALLGSLFVAYLAYKWRQRQRFFKALRVARISVDELKGLFAGEKKPVVVDVRSSVARKSEPRVIPGALIFDMAGVQERIGGLPRDTELIFYCTCPNEASAAAIARRLIERGYKRVRPLLGGLDAWIAAGYRTELRNVT